MYKYLYRLVQRYLPRPTYWGGLEGWSPPQDIQKNNNLPVLASVPFPREDKVRTRFGNQYATPYDTMHDTICDINMITYMAPYHETIHATIHSTHMIQYMVPCLVSYMTNHDFTCIRAMPTWVKHTLHWQITIFYLFPEGASPSPPPGPPISRPGGLPIW